MKRYFLIFAVCLMMNGAAAMAQDQMPRQPKFLLVKGIKEDANYVLQSKNPDAVLKQEGIDDYDFKTIAAVQERAANCLQKVKQLFDSGAPETEEIEVVTGKTTVGELSEKMLDINRKAIYIGMIHKLQQSAMRTKNWVEDVGQKGKLKYDQLNIAASEGENLEKVVVAAQKLGFPDDYKISFWKNSYTLPELKEMGHYVATAGGQLKKEIEAPRAAKDAPYLSLLKGDKLRIFKEEFAGQGGMFEVLTSGGSALATPAAMNAAGVWYTWGNNRGVVDTWHITGWRFQGDKLVGRSSRSGLGLRPSAAAFR
jgi:hypothetical protein